jgi:hypothetical protein
MVQSGDRAIGMDLGAPTAYTALQPGTAVYDRDGDRVGVVRYVLADEAQDIFHGLVIRTRRLPDQQHLVALADQVGELYERGVLLAVDAGALYDPSAFPGTSTSRTADGESPLEAALRRAWDRINRPV